MLKSNSRNARVEQSDDEVLDLWAIFMRHWKVIASTLMVTGAIGVFYYLVAPPTYCSTASLLIETKKNPAFDQRSVEDRPTEIQNVETHAFTIRSRMIIGQAFRDFELGELESLQELESEDEKIKFVIENLEAEVAEDETSAIALSYRGKSAEDCETIVAAITNTYEMHLGERIQSVSTKTSSLIVEAKDELLTQIEAKEAEYHEFQREAPLMWKSGEGINLHRERQMELERERSTRLIERAKLVAKIEAVELALARGGESREAVYFEAINELHPDNDDEEFVVEREAARGYSVELSREYVDLVMRVKEMSERFGEGHPDLVSLQNRVAAMRQMLDHTLGNEDSPQDPELGPAVDAVSRGVDYVEVYRHLLRERLSVVDTELRELNDSFEAEQLSANQMQSFMAEDQMKRSDIERLTKLFDAVVARLEEITLIRDYGGDTMLVLESARLGEQVAPSLLLVGLLSLVSGVFVGSVVAIAMDLTEATFRNPSEIRQLLETPIIGRIPRWARDNLTLPEYSGLDASICTAHRRESTDAEAYRGVRTALFFSGSSQRLKVVQITSPMPGDGKSTLTANLAVTIAQSNKRVIVLDADFRKPVVHELFGIEEDRRGLSDVVSGEVDLPKAICKTQFPNLHVLIAGSRPDNPSELLSSDALNQTIDRLRNSYDFVLIDTPPLLAVTDPSIVSARVDGVIMAIKIYKGVREAARRSKEILDSMDASLVGVVVNGMEQGSARYGFQGGYGYGAVQGYGQDSQESLGRAKPNRPAFASRKHRASESTPT